MPPFQICKKRLLIQREDKKKVNLKIKVKVSKQIRSIMLQRKKVIVGIVIIMIKMIILMLNVGNYI